MTAQMALPTVASSAGAARRLVQDELLAAGLAGLVEPTQLLVSEVVTNALLHGTGEVQLRVTSDTGRGWVRLEVRDDSSALPERRHNPEDATTGRGMMLVEALASDWGVELRGGGKVVWFEMLDGQVDW